MTAASLAHAPPSTTTALFRPFRGGGLELANRIVMAPMTRPYAENGVPHAGFADYYRRRAEGGVGLIVTQGTWIPHALAGDNPLVPRFYGEDALDGWRRVVDAVHTAGARVVPQLWHVGLYARERDELPVRTLVRNGPSGVARRGVRVAQPMTQRDIDDVIEAFAVAAVLAQRLGFDGVEIHAAHGYLLDQFFWSATNLRTDRYGGDLHARTRFAVEVVEEIKRRTGAAFPVLLRFSQWKQQELDVRPIETAEQLARWLEPLAAAGVDVFHCSTRRFSEPAFDGSDLTLAGWTKLLTGRPTIAVGGVGLDVEPGALRRDLDALTGLLDGGEFDLIALGRTLIANPDWPALVRRAALDRVRPYTTDALADLV